MKSGRSLQTFFTVGPLTVGIVLPYVSQGDDSIDYPFWVSIGKTTKAETSEQKSFFHKPPNNSRVERDLAT